MRRFLYWTVPAVLALASTILFAGGFYTFLRGDVGTQVGPIRQTYRASEPPRGVIAPIILGDSLARGTGDESGLGIGGRLTAELKRNGVNVRPAVNLAVNGAKTPDLLALLQRPNVQTLIGESNVIVVSIGGNDLWGETSELRGRRPPDAAPLMNAVLDRVTTIIEEVRRANPKGRIFVIGLYNPFARSPFGPSLGALVARWNARLIDRFAGDPNVTIVETSDIFSHRARLSLDSFHPNDEGYALIARRIAESI